MVDLDIVMWDGWEEKQIGKENMNVPALDEISEVFTPFDLIFRFVFQPRGRLSYNVGQQIDQTCPGLYLRAIGWERETVLCYFQQSDTERPDIGSDGVGLTGNTLRCHVV